jgi:hypothetical protein
MTQPRISVTFTALIWLGIVLAMLGAVVAVLGLGGSTVFEVTVHGITVKTSQTGLAILAIGALLSGLIAVKIPKGVRVMAKEEKHGLTEKLLGALPPAAFAILLLAVALIIVQFLFAR